MDTTDSQNTEDSLQGIEVRNIDWDTHSLLLEESISNYSFIWKELAKR